MFDLNKIPIIIPKIICLDMVMAGIFDAIFNPAIPAHKAGNNPNHTVVAVTITPKIIPCNHSRWEFQLIQL